MSKLIEAGDVQEVFSIHQTETDARATRWVWFAGNILSVERLRDRPDLAKLGGGAEVDASALLRTKGFIRRRRFTPLSRTVDLETKEVMGSATNVDYTVLTGAPKPAMVGREVLPGRQLDAVLGVQMGAPAQKLEVGIVEIPALFDIPYEEFPKTGFQPFFVPSYPSLSMRLAELEAEIRAVVPRNAEEKDTHERLLESCRRFRLFGEVYVEANNQLIRMGANDMGFAHGYSGLSLTLIEQLDLQREDEHLRNAATTQMTLAQSQAKMAEALEKILSGQVATKDEGVQQMMLTQMRELEARLAKSEAANQELQTKFEAAAKAGSNGKTGGQK